MFEKLRVVKSAAVINRPKTEKDQVVVERQKNQN